MGKPVGGVMSTEAAPARRSSAEAVAGRKKQAQTASAKAREGGNMAGRSVGGDQLVSPMVARTTPEFASPDSAVYWPVAWSNVAWKSQPWQ